MRFVAVFNKDGGTLRTTDLDVFCAHVRTVLEGAGHSVDIRIVDGKHVVAELQKAAAEQAADVLVAGGGDGTVSAAAAALMNGKMALAVLPAGTMNLFARSLGIPQSLEAALHAFVDGEIRAVDIATANGRPFVHQFSIGMHARMVHLRDQMEYRSRIGKIGASLKAAYRTVLNPPTLKVTLTIDGTELVARTSGIGISNNLFGEGHLPYADHPDGGLLGVYVTVARQRMELLRLAINMARGRWRDNSQIELHQAQRVTLTLPRRHRHFKAVVDGELCGLDRETVLEIHPGALNVFVPHGKMQGPPVR